MQLKCETCIYFTQVDPSGLGHCDRFTQEVVKDVPRGAVTVPYDARCSYYLPNMRMKHKAQ